MDTVSAQVSISPLRHTHLGSCISKAVEAPRNCGLNIRYATSDCQKRGWSMKMLPTLQDIDT